MQLDKINTVLRPRNPWESIDLGFLLTRSHARPLAKLWLAFFLPLSAFLYAACYKVPWLAGIILWWLKPLYDRILLYFFSRALFDEYPERRDLRKNLRGILKSRLFSALTYGRISLVRSFHLPVWQLEGLPRKDGRVRIRILEKETRGYAVMLTIICIHLEWVLYLSLFVLLYMLAPITYEFDWNVFLLEEGDESFWLSLLGYSFSVMTIAIIEPLYVAGGFALYLNRRTLLEGWDIELVFRRLAARLQSAAAALLLFFAVGAGLMSYAPPSEARESTVAAERAPAESAPRHIQEILAAEEFATRRERSGWRSKNPSEDEDEAFNFDWFKGIGDLAWLGRVFAQLIEIILWGALALALVLIIWYGRRYLSLPARSALSSTKKETQLPLALKHVSAVLEPGTDVVAQALQACREGHSTKALGLLYCGALVNLLHKGLRLHDGATESECVRRVKQYAAAPAAEYFSRLTRAWQQAAYAHRIPDFSQVEQLCRDWRAHFGATV